MTNLHAQIQEISKKFFLEKTQDQTQNLVNKQLTASAFAHLRTRMIIHPAFNRCFQKFSFTEIN